MSGEPFTELVVDYSPRETGYRTYSYRTIHRRTGRWKVEIFKADDKMLLEETTFYIR